MAHKMHLWISEMNYVLFNGFLVHLNTHYLTPNFKLEEAEGEFLPEPHLFIQGDAINLSLQLDSDTFRISQAPGGGVCHNIGQADLKMQSVAGIYICHLVSPVFSWSYV
jgi:hypothetical protein